MTSINNNSADLTINEIKTTYTIKTGKTLPTEFWQYWDQWRIACANNDMNKAREMCSDPAMYQYSLWIQEVKTVVKTNDNDKKYD